MTNQPPQNKFPTHKDHLNKTFLEELNYKFWTTKGARFKANKRLLTRADLSHKAIAFLSAYLIIFGLFAVYRNVVGLEAVLNDSIIAFGSTVISILLLAFSQMEAAQDYKVKAISYLECALKIGRIYDELRIYKTIEGGDEKDKEAFCKQISDKYQALLENYPNHNDIDYQIFRTEQSDQFPLTKFRVFMIRFKYYRQVKLIYHLLIFGPPMIILLIILFTKSSSS